MDTPSPYNYVYSWLMKEAIIATYTHNVMIMTETLILKALSYMYKENLLCAQMPHLLSSNFFV